MSNANALYVKYGKRAARLSLAFPGLGQLHNKHYLKGMVVIGIFSFSVALLILLHLKGPNSSTFLRFFPLLPLVTWGISIFDAFYSAIEGRDAKRFNVQLLTTVRGFDVNKRNFEETVITKNVSKLGACLIMSREISEGSQLVLEFEGKPKSRARVIWARETSNRNERLVGVELLTPLKRI